MRRISESMKLRVWKVKLRVLPVPVIFTNPMLLEVRGVMSSGDIWSTPTGTALMEARSTWVVSSLMTLECHTEGSA